VFGVFPSSIVRNWLFLRSLSLFIQDQASEICLVSQKEEPYKQLGMNMKSWVMII
jgi:hypothetical protein